MDGIVSATLSAAASRKGYDMRASRLVGRRCLGHAFMCGDGRLRGRGTEHRG